MLTSHTASSLPIRLKLPVQAAAKWQGSHECRASPPGCGRGSTIWSCKQGHIFWLHSLHQDVSFGPTFQGLRAAGRQPRPHSVLCTSSPSHRMLNRLPQGDQTSRPERQNPPGNPQGPKFISPSTWNHSRSQASCHPRRRARCLSSHPFLYHIGPHAAKLCAQLVRTVKSHPSLSSRFSTFYQCSGQRVCRTPSW